MACTALGPGPRFPVVERQGRRGGAAVRSQPKASRVVLISAGGPAPWSVACAEVPAVAGMPAGNGRRVRRHSVATS